MHLPRHATALLLTVACAGEPPLTYTLDTLPGGGTIVTNLGPSGWGATGELRLVPERVIAPRSGSAGEIGSPDGVAIDDRGRVYVIQRQPHAIKVFDAEGQFLRDLSREGEGPGEFRVGYIGVFADTVALQDPATSRFTTIRLDGTLVQVHPSPCCWATSYLDIDQRGVAAVPGSIGDTGAGLVRFRLDGTVLDTISLPDEPAPAKEWHAEWNADGRHWNMRIPAPLQPRLHQRYGGDGVLVYGSTDSATLVVSRTGRDTVRVIRTTVPRVPIDMAQGDSIFRAHLAGMEWKAEWLSEGGREDVPPDWPPWTTFAIDRQGRIWLGLPGPEGRASSAQVFDTSGVLLGIVSLPRPDLLDGAWATGRVAILDEDADGFPIVRVYRITTN